MRHSRRLENIMIRLIGIATALALASVSGIAAAQNYDRYDDRYYDDQHHSSAAPIVFVLVARLRRSGVGLATIAVRDNPSAAAGSISSIGDLPIVCLTRWPKKGARFCKVRD